MPRTVVGENPAPLQQGAIQLPQVGRREPGELFLPQVGLDMVVKVTSVLFQGAGPEGEGHLFQPAVQPLRQGHAAALRQVHALVSVDILPELGRQLLWAVSVNVSEDGVAVFLVAHHEPASISICSAMAGLWHRPGSISRMSRPMASAARSRTC